LNNVRTVGWHEHGWKKNTYRYWTGKTWVNPGDDGYDSITTPKPVRTNPQTMATGWWFVTIAVPVLALIVAMLTLGTGTPDNSTTDADTAVVADKPDIPTGFTDNGNGIALKWLKEGDDGFAGGCEYSIGPCFKMAVYAYESCPASVYAEVNGVNSAGTVIASSNDALSALNEGETGALEFTFTDRDVLHAKFTNASCF
jgi:hypothetical protein